MIAPPKAKRGDALVCEVETILKPLLARSSEKAELLLEHFGQAGSPRGLTSALKLLRAAKFSDAQISAGATALMADLSKRHGGREKVV